MYLSHLTSSRKSSVSLFSPRLTQPCPPTGTPTLLAPVSHNRCSQHIGRFSKEQKKGIMEIPTPERTFFVCVRARPVQPLVCAGRDGKGRPTTSETSSANCLYHRVETLPIRLSPCHHDTSNETSCLTIPNKQICETFMNENQNTAVS